MTIEEIKRSIDHIEAVKIDYEAAHSEEDDLREEFISYIANGGNENLEEKAKIILSTNDISFQRYCA